MSKKGTIKDLIKLFKNGDAWCKRANARAKNNRAVDDTSDKAIKFCLLGGMNRVNLCMNDRKKISSRVAKLDTVVYAFNDNRKTKLEDVKKLLQSCLPKKKK